MSLMDVHVCPTFLNSVVSLPMLIQKGCEVVHASSSCIEIKTAFQGERETGLRFVKGEDDLFGIKIDPMCQWF